MSFVMESFMSTDNFVIYLLQKSKTNKVYQTPDHRFIQQTRRNSIPIPNIGIDCFYLGLQGWNFHKFSSPNHDQKAGEKSPKFIQIRINIS